MEWKTLPEHLIEIKLKTLQKPDRIRLQKTHMGKNICALKDIMSLVTYTE